MDLNHKFEQAGQKRLAQINLLMDQYLAIKAIQDQFQPTLDLLEQIFTEYELPFTFNETKSFVLNQDGVSITAQFSFSEKVNKQINIIAQLNYIVNDDDKCVALDKKTWQEKKYTPSKTAQKFKDRVKLLKQGLQMSLENGRDYFILTVKNR